MSAVLVKASANGERGVDGSALTIMFGLTLGGECPRIAGHVYHRQKGRKKSNIGVMENRATGSIRVPHLA
jgi:hypothetical protein